MKRAILITTALAMLTGPAMANPAVDSWPWQDTTVAGNSLQTGDR